MTNRGFSLIEVIAAMIILSVGIIGMAASTSAITRMTGQGALSGASAAVAVSRFDQLRATACGSQAGGTATTGKFSEKWTVSTSGNIVNVIDSITYISSRRSRTDAYSTILSCNAVTQ